MRKGWLLLLCLLTACSGSKMLDNTTAEKTIQKLLDNQFFIYSQIGRIGADCGTKTVEGAGFAIGSKPDAEEIAAMAAGYITVEPDGPNFRKVTLTQQGRTAANREPYGGTVQKGCDFKQTEFPVATRKLVQIDGITADENNPEVEYLWRWKVTKLGEALREDGAAYKALTPDQRSSLERLGILALGSFEHMELPIPPEDTILKSTVRFKRFTDGWRIK